jgi:hypothetical protein
MPANTIVIPIKAIYTNGDVTALGELNPGDKLSSDFINLSSYVANSEFQAFIANTNAYIADVAVNAGEVSNAYLTSTFTTNTDFQAALANTNAYIAYVAANAGEVSNAYLTSTFTTNTAFQSAVTSLNLSVDDRMQVANVTAAISTAISGLVDSAPATLDTLNELAAALNDDANFASTVTTSLAGKASNSFVTSTYTTNTDFQSALANTNAWIATVAATPSGLSNSEVNTLIDGKLQVLELGDVVGTDGNPGQIIFSNGDGTGYWANNNPAVDLSGYVETTTFNSALANTNSYIGTKLDSSSYTTADVQSKAALANTNAYIATKTDDATVLATNTALRVLIDDRMQVANVTSAISTAISNLVDTAPATLDTLNELAAALGDDANFASTVTTSLAGKASNAAFQSALANTNAYIATKADSTTVASNLANTNAYIATKLDSSTYTTADVQSKAALANTNAYIATKADSSTVESYLANTNAYIAYVAANAGEVSNAYLTSTFTTNTAFQSALANTNAWIATVAATPSGLSNTEVNTLIDGKLQVLELGDIVGTDGNPGQIIISNGDGTGYWSNNTPAVDLSGYVETTTFNSALANTNAYVATKADSTTVASNLANTNAYIATKTDDTVALATNTALRILVDDRMQVANVTSAISTAIANLVDTAPSTLDTLNELAAALGDDANFASTVTTSLAGKASNADFQSALANTNAWIATVAATPSGLSNTEVNTLIDGKLQVLELGDIVGSDGNPGQIIISNGDGTGYWANNSSGGGTVDLSAVAQSIVPSANVTYDLGSSTNAWRDLYLSGNTVYLAGQAAITVDGTGSIVLPASTKIGTDTLGASYASNAALQSAIANTNAYIATKTDDTVALATNTALRLLVDDRMQVANVTSAISTAIANLVDTAPATLDTLNELAAALGDDANFASTVTTSLAGKVSNTDFQSALANTNAYIASATAASGNASITVANSTPVSPVEGNLWFDNDTLKTYIYVSSNWVQTNPTPDSTAGMVEYEYTSANNQTTYSGVDNYSSTLSYTPGNILVFMNGIKLARADYVANTGTSVVLSSAAAEDDIVEIVSYK